MSQYERRLLIANPKLPDDNFFRTVVLLISHDQEGAFGVVLNRPTQFNLRGLAEQLEIETINSDLCIHWGGPVPGPPIALHQNPLLAGGQVLEDLFISTDMEQIRRLADSNDQDVRLFMGYSGWGSGQLENELKAGGWFTSQAASDHVFKNDEGLWKRVAESVGAKVMGHHLAKSKIPDDPSLN
jgi:putative transcriptional regulator